MTVGTEPGVNEILRRLYAEHRGYNAIGFNEFLSVVAGSKNMLTRYTKSTLSAGEGALVNSVITVANTLGKETRIVYEIPVVSEPHYSVIRAILHHLGLPYSAGPLCPRMTEFLRRLDYQIKFFYSAEKINTTSLH